MEGAGGRPNAIVQETSLEVVEGKLLQSVRLCIMKLLKLEGSDWLFKQNDGIDEDLIDRVAAREKFVYEIEARETNQGIHLGDTRYFISDRKPVSVSSVPTCGEGCVWRTDLIISFGVWCIHRILDLSVLESRPELWGKYTYVLNRLQGIIEPAFSKPRTPSAPCFCLQVPTSHQHKSSPPLSNGMLPPTVKAGRGKCTTASTLLELIKDVEIAISSRKGRTGTAAGDVAFPKGKENLASVLKRYKRRLSSNKLVGNQDGTGSRKVASSGSYNQ
jgi:ethylene-insensitive protein 2